MSDTERTPAPRRSGRDKKLTQQFGFSSPSKRKRVEDYDGFEDNVDDEIPLYAESDDEDDYAAPRKPKNTGKGKAKTRTPAGPKKPRAAKINGDTGKTPTRKGRKAGASKTTTSKAPEERKLLEDNALFNSIMNPAAALQSTVEDFLDSFQQSPQVALADLINCILRTCGSNDSVDSDRAVDYDGIVDALDDFTEALKEDEAPTYPLTSKHPIFKKFRKSLSEFLHRLIKSAAELETLYNSDLLMTIQAWVVAMSSSQLRSFRHTATVIALEIESMLCEVAAAVEKEAELTIRQREAERKRKSGQAKSAREKELDVKAAEIKDKRTKLVEYLKEFFDGVFVHRYRDLDPGIRSECVHALGDWLKVFPAYFLDGNYLRYIGWVLSDANNHVRLEAAKSLVSLYAKEDYIVSLQSFTDRFKPRLVEMATSDTEMHIRVTVVQVLSAIDAHGLLEEEQRSALCLLVYDADAKVRRAVSAFVHGVWSETTEQRLVGKKRSSELEKKRAGLKALAHLFVQWGRTLDRINGSSEDNNDGESSSQGDGPSTSSREISNILSSQQKGRIALAIEALWEELPIITDWEAMLELLLLDHSAGVEVPTTTPRRKKAKKAQEESQVDEAWRLNDAEEAILIEVLIAALRKSIAEAALAKRGDEEREVNEITRELIKSLPSLLAKHQTDENRIANILLIPELMNMDLYLEMRMINAYEALWDDITKQFLTHSSNIVLANSIVCVRHFMEATSLSNTNSAKIIELEDELASSLRDAIGGRDELEVASFTDDEAHVLGAICSRICALIGSRDMTTWMEEDEEGKQSSAWDTICALAERGRLGYKEEEIMIDRSLCLLTLHIMWKARSFARNTGSEDRVATQESLREQRDVLLEKLLEYAVGTQSNTLISVRRSAFQNLLTLYTLFSAGPNQDEAESPLAPLSLTMTDEVQVKCAGFIHAEIERYAEELEGDRPEREDNDEDSDSGDDSPEEAQGKQQTRGTKGKNKKSANADETENTSKPQLEQEYIFNATMTAFLRALRAGVIHVQHGSVLLAHHGRLGPAFDLSSKLMIDILREEGMYNDNGQLVVDVIVDSLRESLTMVLDRVVETEQNASSLAKSLVPCLIIRGAQLSVVRKLPTEYVVQIQTKLLSWIVKRISAYESTKNNRLRNKTITFFRVLIHLLVGIEPRDALGIKAHLDQDIAMLNIDIPSTSKAWEPYRAYEKRLTTASTKEKGASGRKPGRQRNGATKSADIVASDTEGVEDDIIPRQNGGPSHSTPKVRPRTTYGRKSATTETDMSELSELSGDELANEELRNPTTNTNGVGSQPSRSPSMDLSTMEEAATPISPQLSSRKRPRSLDNGDEPGGSITGDDSLPTDAESPVAATASPPQTGEFIIRRKRVRH